jgi:hypothetical protein
MHKSRGAWISIHDCAHKTELKMKIGYSATAYIQYASEREYLTTNDA